MGDDDCLAGSMIPNLSACENARRTPSGDQAKRVPNQPYTPPDEASRARVALSIFPNVENVRMKRSLFACQPGAVARGSAVL